MPKITTDEIRQAAEADLSTFIKLVAPHRVLGSIHEELIDFWTRDEAEDHQLVLLPRDHCKSSMVAYRVAWWITTHPDTTVLYISSTANLAEKQLYFIKNILTSAKYQKYWPDMVNKEEGKRERWTTTEISVDHPKRKEEGVRDPTVFSAGLTTSITGLHFDLAVLDDVVVKENAYTAEGRQRVREQYSLLASIEKADSQEWVVGTRYHPKDLYQNLMEMEEDIYDDMGELTGSLPIYEIFERKVEDNGDGTGEFLWPRQRRTDGKWFGFDRGILAKKRAKYLDRTQFYAQYYNDPNDPEGQRIATNLFQYYDKKYLDQFEGTWYYKDRPLNVFASIDFAFSLKQKADYTAIVVIGIDPDSNIYVLDIDRFKTDRISEYFAHILHLHVRWGFRKLRAEVNVGQDVIVKDLKHNHIRKNGMMLSIDEFRPTRGQGTKQERMSAILEPRYDNMAIWHYRGGNCQILEEELIVAHPPHDDCMDALASAIDIALPPARHSMRMKTKAPVITHSRFGGMR